jgi:ribosome-associated toxin RatA of RatAB toxin-antitoxin module
MRYALLITCLLSALIGYGQNGCVLRKEKDSIRVFTCDNENSKFKTIKAEVMMNATLSQVASIIMDVEQYDEWQFNTVASKILDKPNAGDVTFYSEVEAPWPIANRDLIIRIQLEQDKKSKVVTLNCNSLPTYLPTKGSLVRVPFSNALWALAPVSKSKVQVNYFIEINPGGSVPAWMVNMVCAQAPYESFRNFKQRLASKRYNANVATTVSDF